LLETTIKVLFGPKNGLVVCPIGLALWGKLVLGVTGAYYTHLPI
jgi:hypothetical protein